MPTTSTTPFPELAAATRTGLRRLLAWIEEHDLSILSVAYADENDAELNLPAGRIDTLLAAAAAAEGLHATTVDVLDVPSKGVTHIHIGGQLAGGDHPISITVSAATFAEGRASLLAALGEPLEPGEPAWSTSSATLRAAATAPAGT